MAENVGNLRMVMLVYERHDYAIVIKKGITFNGSAIGAFDVVTSCPSGKVVIELFAHFEISP
jgi:hypothetical protein